MIFIVMSFQVQAFGCGLRQDSCPEYPLCGCGLDAGG
jgi:hypothetical protein